MTAGGKRIGSGAKKKAVKNDAQYPIRVDKIILDKARKNWGKLFSKKLRYYIEVLSEDKPEN
jgi:hypothetical protein